MKNVLFTLAVLGGLALAGAAAVVSLGLYNVSAAGGHFPGVSWVLHTTFRNSVALRAPPGASVPDLEAAGLVRLGAGHYDTACKMCHGAPGVERSATVRAMNPVPPPIGEAVSHWQPAELFWIVKNGVKMSGMPAWPTPERDSDVWAIVAFLTEVGEMETGTYAALTGRPETGGDATLAYCAMCHGTDGRGHGNPQVPRLDILSPQYIASALAAYRNGRRPSGVMQHAVSGLEDTQIARLATHFGNEPSSGEALPDDAAEHPGAAIAFGAFGDDVPACAACHGPWEAPLPAEHPSLQGQRLPYLVEQLRLWKTGERGGSERARLMHEVVPELDRAEIEAVARFYSAMSSARPAE